jgi:predicted CoA-binding protein
MPTLEARIAMFLDGEPFAVVGASTNRDKYGNKVLRAYLQQDRPVYPVNPRAEEIEGVPSYPSLADLPRKPHGVSVITPPKISKQVVEEAAQLGIQHVWMQPGAEFDDAVEFGAQRGVHVIAGDACVLVVMGYHEAAS